MCNMIYSLVKGSKRCDNDNASRLSMFFENRVVKFIMGNKHSLQSSPPGIEMEIRDLPETKLSMTHLS